MTFDHTGQKCIAEVELERELAVARQTIRSLQDALAAEHRDDQALVNAVRHVIDNSPGTPDSVKKYLRGALADAALASSGSEREQELTNALQRIADDDRRTRPASDPIPAVIDGKDAHVTYVELESLRDIARAALAPAVEEQR